MATKSLCSIPDCGKPTCNSRGWCTAHYTRWRRHGDPSGIGTTHGEPQAYFADVVLTYKGADCLTWPYSRNMQGYGILWADRAMRGVHRLVCSQVHGAPPTSDHVAAHECGNGHLGCCNPNHITWKTKEENQADRLRHGTDQLGQNNASAKLTDNDVRKIRALKGIRSQREIGEMFGVGQIQVGRIQRRERWGWLD